MKALHYIIIQVAPKALLAYLSRYSIKIVLFIKSVNLNLENVKKCFNNNFNKCLYWSLTYKYNVPLNIQLKLANNSAEFPKKYEYE